MKLKTNQSVDKTSATMTDHERFILALWKITMNKLSPVFKQEEVIKIISLLYELNVDEIESAILKGFDK